MPEVTFTARTIYDRADGPTKTIEVPYVAPHGIIAVRNRGTRGKPDWAALHLPSGYIIPAASPRDPRGSGFRRVTDAKRFAKVLDAHLHEHPELIDSEGKGEWTDSPEHRAEFVAYIESVRGDD